MIKIAAVSPVHNRKLETLQCLRSLFKADLTGISLDVIIVDDGSTDGTSEALATEFPDVRIIHGDGDLWYTAGTNRGLAEALKSNADYILAFNNDSIFDRNFLRSMLDTAERHKRSVVGPLLLNWETPHKIFQVAPKWDVWRGGYRHWRKQTIWTVPAKPWTVELIVGNCVLFPAGAIRETGLMDEKNLVQFGDADYTPRMKRLGWRLIIDPRARVFCKPNDVIVGFRSLPARKQIDLLFRSPHSPYSFQRRFYGNLKGAPNKLQGLAATPIFYLRYILGISQEGSWGEKGSEPPLSKIYERSVLND